MHFEEGLESDYRKVASATENVGGGNRVSMYGIGSWLTEPGIAPDRMMM